MELRENRECNLNGVKGKNKLNNPEDEIQAGKYYIDSLGVNSNHLNKGIDTKLSRFY